MNPLDTPWGVPDLEATMAGRPDSYLVPKVRTKDDLLKIDTILSRRERDLGFPPGGVKLVVLATETPQGLLNIRDFGSVPTGRCALVGSRGFIGLNRCTS